MKLKSEEKKIIYDFFELLFSKMEEATKEKEEAASEVVPDQSQNRFIPDTQWNKYLDWPSVPGLRHLIFYEHQNGFSKCIRRAGRRVLINEQAFFEWLQNNKFK